MLMPFGMNVHDTCKRQNGQKINIYSRSDLENIFKRSPNTLVDIILDLTASKKQQQQQQTAIFRWTE